MDVGALAQKLEGQLKLQTPAVTPIPPPPSDPPKFVSSEDELPISELNFEDVDNSSQDLPPELKNRIMRVFSMYQNHSKFMPQEQIPIALKVLGFTDKQIPTGFTRSTIGLWNFERLVKNLLQTQTLLPQEDRTWVRIFQTFDHKNTGFISKSSLRRIW